jgi:hypothetical protein
MNSLFSFFLVLLISAKLSAQQDCYIQVKAEPNISVFLNEEFKGITNEEYSGLIIQKLKAGTYYIKVVKDGYEPQAEPIVLKPGEVKIYQVKPFVPRYRITQSGGKQQRTLELKTGSLRIQSLPAEIQIEITDLNIVSSKSDDEWNIEDIPVGLHKIKFSWGDKILFDTIRIEQDKFKHIFADLINNKIVIRSNNIYQDDPDAYAASKTSMTGQGVSYDLGGRSALRLATPKYNIEEEGRIVVEINIDRNGKVVQAVAGVKGSTTLNVDLLRAAKNAALQSVFEKNPNAPLVQKGTITYNFLLR